GDADPRRRRPARRHARGPRGRDAQELVETPGGAVARAGGARPQERLAAAQDLLRKAARAVHGHGAGRERKEVTVGAAASVAVWRSAATLAASPTTETVSCPRKPPTPPIRPPSARRRWKSSASWRASA